MLISPLFAVDSVSRGNLSIFDPVSPPATEISKLFLLVLVVCAVIFLLVEGVLIYSIICFRRADREATEPPQVYGSNPIEIAWTIAPALIVFLLILVVVRTELGIRIPIPPPAKGDNALHVTVIGHQWWWEYRYDHFNGEPLGFATANELHVPTSTSGVDRKIYLTLESADVCHSFWVPRLAGKTDLIPGRTNHTWFSTEAAGLYLGQCAEYCGTQHANMMLRVQAQPPEEFQAWLDHQQRDASPGGGGEGRQIFFANSCISCHTIRGTKARGTVGPDLTHLMSRETLVTGMVPNTSEELFRWVTNPADIKPGCLMPAFKLGPQQTRKVVEYLQTLK